MKPEFESVSERVQAAPESLRRVAQVTPPEGITERVHRRLFAEATEPQARGFWRLWLPAHRVQFAGAALLVAVISVSTVAVRQQHAGKPAGAPGAQDGRTGMGTAGAERHPASLKPILVPDQAKKKPSASHKGKHDKTAGDHGSSAGQDKAMVRPNQP